MKKKDRYELDKICAYCEKATVLAGGEHVLCEKKGVVADSYHCRKFVYDPVKRIPKRARPLPEAELDAEALLKPSEAECSAPDESAEAENAESTDESGESGEVFPELELPKIDNIV